MGAVSRAHDNLVYRARAAMRAIGPDDLTLDELCKIVPIMEAAADRETGPVDNSNIITFAACRRRRARRVASRKQSGGDD